MAFTSDFTAAVKVKLHITWSDPATDAEVEQATETAAGRLERLVALPSGTISERVETDAALRGLLLDAILYEFNGAWDDFLSHYDTDLQSTRLFMEAATGGDPDGSEEA